MEKLSQIANIPFSNALTLLGMVVGISLLTWGISRLIWPILLWLARKTHLSENNWLTQVLNPVAFLIAVAVGYSIRDELHQRLTLKTSYTDYALTIMVYTGVAWLIFKAIDLLLQQLGEKMRFRKQGARANMLPLLGRSLKAFLGVLILVQLLQNAGVDVGALITGLGIGGLALALAGQKTIENLFGGIMLVMDQPFRVGDYVKIEDLTGTVEDIGWRSSRIRTLENTIVTIPNASLSEKVIDNYAKRRQILLRTTIGVRYDATPDQLRYLLISIKKMLLAHPKVTDEPSRVRFVNFGSYTLDLEIFCYIATNDYNEYLGVREDIFLRLMDLVHEAGTDFAFPTQTEISEKWFPLDADKVKQAEKAVADMRENKNLLLPDVPEKTKAELDDTLDYPPTGAAILQETKGKKK